MNSSGAKSTEAGIPGGIMRGWFIFRMVIEWILVAEVYQNILIY